MTASNKEIVESFIDAYNAGDDEGVLSYCDENIYVIHHNRNVIVEGKSAFRENLAIFKGLVEGKHFSNRRAMHVDGDNVLVEHTWNGKALESIPGFAEKNEVIKLDLCTRYTLKNGLIADYHDYG
jgi:ketosteroid isomerase-like protein